MTIVEVFVEYYAPHHPDYWGFAGKIRTYHLQLKDVPQIVKMAMKRGACTVELRFPCKNRETILSDVSNYMSELLEKISQDQAEQEAPVGLSVSQARGQRTNLPPS